MIGRAVRCNINTSWPAKEAAITAKEIKSVDITVGLPRAMMYYRYHILWERFFAELGIKTITSPRTDKQILDRGSSIAVDEMCLSSKIFFGHVEWLIGKCDYILVPRFSSFGWHQNMCTRFEALYDICRNVFRRSGQQFITYNVDVINDLTEDKAFVQMGQELGFEARTALAAYKTAKKAYDADLKLQIKKQDALAKRPGRKVILAGHSYVIEDAFIGRPVTDNLKKAGITVLRADITDRDAALKKSAKFSPTMKWQVNREITAGLLDRYKAADGVILLSVFPCGPDSMTNDITVRRLNGLPTINIVMDGQSGTAGLETRLESFVDILERRSAAK